VDTRIARSWRSASNAHQLDQHIDRCLADLPE
jgi:hypothetical protein